MSNYGVPLKYALGSFKIIENGTIRLILFMCYCKYNYIFTVFQIFEVKASKPIDFCIKKWDQTALLDPTLKTCGQLTP